jgi:hypothetical protein
MPSACTTTSIHTLAVVGLLNILIALPSTADIIGQQDSALMHSPGMQKYY